MSTPLTFDPRLPEFVRESNHIEGIEDWETAGEIQAHEFLLRARNLTTEIIETFVSEIANASLREKHGMDVMVGSHLPPKGGPWIREALAQLLHLVNEGEHTPYEVHVKYEALHPFMDGNGRSGRAIWAWQMRRDGLDPFALSFLHRFYYQALDAPRKGGA